MNYYTKPQRVMFRGKAQTVWIVTDGTTILPLINPDNDNLFTSRRGQRLWETVKEDVARHSAAFWNTEPQYRGINFAKVETYAKKLGEHGFTTNRKAPQKKHLSIHDTYKQYRNTEPLQNTHIVSKVQGMKVQTLVVSK